MPIGPMLRAPLPARPGARPTTTPATPHIQIDQPAPPEIQAELWRRMSNLPAVTAGRSGISAPSSRALHLDPALARDDREAYLRGTEFAHLHGDGTGSLHLTLSRQRAAEAIEKGWADLHPAVRLGLMPPALVMLYGARDGQDLETVWRLVQESYAFARNARRPSLQRQWPRDPPRRTARYGAHTSRP